MMFDFSPAATYALLLFVQAGHLLHHRLAKRHISFVEVIAGAVLCVPPTVAVVGWLLMSAHLNLIVAPVGKDFHHAARSVERTLTPVARRSHRREVRVGRKMT